MCTHGAALQYSYDTIMVHCFFLVDSWFLAHGIQLADEFDNVVVT
jgi:hypothetical protein